MVCKLGAWDALQVTSAWQVVIACACSCSRLLKDTPVALMVVLGCAWTVHIFAGEVRSLLLSGECAF